MYWKHLFPTFFAQQTSRNKLESGREKDIKNDKMQTSDVGTTLIVKKQCEGARHQTDWQQVPTAIQHPWNVIQPANNIGRQLRYILKTNKQTHTKYTRLS